MANDKASEPLSAEALFDRATMACTSTPFDDDVYWLAVRTLQQAAPNEVWPLITPLADDPEPRHRALVPDVLRYLGGPEKPLRDDTVRLLAKMLETERAACVLQSIANAFVDLQDPGAIELLRPLASHPDAIVREAFIHGVLPFATTAVPELVTLSTDECDEVRNWATFGLGSQLGGEFESDALDTPVIRDALVARLDDPHDETRAEAVLGLALRRDDRAVPVIVREIERGTGWVHYAEAAERLSDPQLYEALVKGAPTSPIDLTKAMTACDPMRAK